MYSYSSFCILTTNITNAHTGISKIKNIGTSRIITAEKSNPTIIASAAVTVSGIPLLRLTSTSQNVSPFAPLYILVLLCISSIIKARLVGSGAECLRIYYTRYRLREQVKGCRSLRQPSSFVKVLCDYIIPIPPPCGIGAGTSFLISATTDSVVRSVEATLVAF